MRFVRLWAVFAVFGLIAVACGGAESGSSEPEVQPTGAAPATELTIPTTSPAATTTMAAPTTLATVPPTTNPYPVQPPTRIPTYDTAWEMAYLATNDEIIAYLDHVYEAGFSGFWFLALPFGGTNLYAWDIPDVDEQLATIDDGGMVRLTDGYTERIQFILDEADRRNLGVGLVAAWAKANSCKTTGVTEQNARAYGEHIGAAFDHVALDYWVLGGDLPFEERCESKDTQRLLRNVTRELHAGIRDSGAEQPTAFHTGAGVDNYDQFFDRDFVDVGAVQTGHCQDAGALKAKLRPVVERTVKPVFLAESRYYQLAPRWNGCLHGPANPINADDIAADAQVALDLGLAGILYGDGQRYQWCRDKSDGEIFDLVPPDYDCPNGITDTFNTEGEKAFLDVFR